MYIILRYFNCKNVFISDQASKVSTFSYSGDPLGVVSSGISKLYSTLTSLAIIFTNRIHCTKAILLCRDILVRTVTICEVLITDARNPANTVTRFATKFLADLAFAWSQLFDFFVQFPVVNSSFELVDLSRENLTHIR